MRGSIYTFMGSIVMVMIGVGIIWWFRSVTPSEAFIVSERHKESFSALNYLELSRKALEEAVVVYAQTGATKAGSAGGLDAAAQQKDKIAIWKDAPDAATIKDTLQRYIVDMEMGDSLKEYAIPGKFLTVTYGSSNIQAIPDNPDFSKSEKFYVKGEKEIKVSKKLDTQAITISSGLKGYVDYEIKLKYFALYNAAKKFLEIGEPKKIIDAAFGSVDTKGIAEKKPAECGVSYTVTWCDGADHTSQTCPKPVVDYPTDKEVLSQSSFSQLGSAAISATMTEEPFKSFNARFDKYELSPSAGYDPADVVTDDTGTCGFSCNYEKACGAPISSAPTCGNGCSYDSGSNSCKQPSCNVEPDCSPCGYDDVTKSCIVPTCGAPIPTTPVCDNGCAYDKPSNTCKSPSYTQSCTAGTKKKTITFTFLADAYEKYFSEDPSGIVPSTSLHDVPVVAKQLPYDTLKFNFMTHSCTAIKSGAVTTELTDNVAACPIPASITTTVP